MTVQETIAKRRSVRRFEDRAVPDGVVNKLLDAAAAAPSGGNIQPLAVIAVRDAGRRARLAEIVGGQPWVANAPLSLVFCLDYYKVGEWAKMYGVDFRGHDSLGFFLIAYADVMCAAQTVVLLAEEKGLGSVYVGTIQSAIPEAREFLKTPERVLPMMVLSLGYPKSVPRNIPKLPRDAIAHDEEYREPSGEAIRAAYEGKYGEIDADPDRYFERAYVEVVEADRQADTGWVDRARKRMDRLHIKSHAEFLFKLRYPTDVFVKMNRRVAEAIRDAGFGFLP